MTVLRSRCAFCFADSSDFPLLTREHLLSRPVASAFGIDRTDPFVRMRSDHTEMRWTTINGVGRKFVCARCNNGWMNALEYDMASVGPWTSTRDEQLGRERARVVSRWAFKTHLILCFLEGNAGSFADPRVDDAVVPPQSLARAVYEKSEELPGLAVGVAASGAASSFAYEFGTPGVVTVGGEARSIGRTAPASVISLGRVQLWVVTPLPLDFTVSVADGVRACSPDVTMSDVLPRPAIGNLSSIRVDYAHDWPRD